MFSLKNWKESTQWQNWTGNQVAHSVSKLLPRSVAEIQDIVRDAAKNGKNIRVTGAGHSFSGCAKPNDIAISLHRMRGIVDIQPEKKEVTLWAGTYLHEIGPLLQPYGLALENMGDIQEQTIAGAICTGTHGTGISLGSVSSQVVGWQWIDGTGELHEHRRSDDDLSMALHISLGLLGIFTQLTIRLVDLYGLAESSISLSFDDAMNQFHTSMYEHRHMEWFLFPGTNIVQQKCLVPIEPLPMSQKQKLKDHLEGIFVLNGAFKFISEVAKHFPSTIRTASRLTAMGIPNTIRQGYAYEIFPKPRSVIFNESEYFISLPNFDSCLPRLNQGLFDDIRGSHFPIEVRPHKGESGFLSPTQGQDSVALSFHVYKGIESEPLFRWLAAEMHRWSGRPHWGKVNRYTPSQFHSLYPHLHKFLEIRAQYDPHNVMVNHWVKKCFGI